MSKESDYLDAMNNDADRNMFMEFVDKATTRISEIFDDGDFAHNEERGEIARGYFFSEMVSFFEQATVIKDEQGVEGLQPILVLHEDTCQNIAKRTIEECMKVEQEQEAKDKALEDAENSLDAQIG